MLNKLKWKFIAAITGIVGAVLLITLIVTLVINYQMNANMVDEQLTEDIKKTILNEQSTIPKIGNENRQLFSVVFILNDNGTLYLPNGSFGDNIISNEILKSLTPTLIKAKDGLGTINEYNIVFKKMKLSFNTYIALANDYKLKEWQDLLYILFPIILIALIIIFIISIAISKWVLKPTEMAMKKQNDFITNVSHDLKTPITVLMANNDILLKKQDDKISNQIQWIKSSQTESKKLLNLVNSMLDLLKSGQTKNKTMEKINFSEIVESESLSFESVAYEQNVKFNINIQSNNYIYANKNDIQKLISTLLDNAFKHSVKNDEVTIILNKCVFTISNKNSVINEEDLPHIFDRFYITDKSRSSSHGLGLAIAKEIVDTHNGKIKVTSTKTEGTKFIVSFNAVK